MNAVFLRAYTDRHIESEEEEYAKWNRYFGAAAETTAN